MRKKIAILLFILVLLNICLVVIGGGPFRPIKRWIYTNHINDKIAHFFFAAVLTFLAYYIFYPRRLKLWFLEIPLGTLILLLIFGFEETIQVFVPGRDADPFDLVASWSGLFLGNWLARLADNKQPLKENDQTV